jgi:hypothetical protein
VDFKKSDLLEEVYVPVYPQLEDTICVLGADNQEWFALVEQADNEERTAIVKWYSETRRPGA